MKIRVCVPFPNGGEIEGRCRASLAALKACKELDVSIYEAQGASISTLRNSGVNNVYNCQSDEIKQGGFDFDYYMSIDSDIEFTVDDVKALIAHDKDIVSGFYQFRVDVGYGTAGTIGGVASAPPIHKDNFLKWQERGVKEVDWVGGGFLLIKREVLECMDYPWFREGVLEYERDGRKCAMWHGEDVGFCLAAKRKGYKVFCDCDVKVKHIIIKPFTRRGGINRQAWALNKIAEIDAIEQNAAGAEARCRDELERLALAKQQCIGARAVLVEMLDAEHRATETEAPTNPCANKTSPSADSAQGAEQGGAVT